MTEPAYFDRTRNGWVLTRYQDVLAAFREPGLRQAEAQPNAAAPRSQARTDASAAISHLKLGQMQSRMTCLIHTIFDRTLPCRDIELIGALIRPWSRELLLESWQCGAGRQRRFVSIANTLSEDGAHGSHALPRLWLALRRKKADRDLKRLSGSTGLAGLKSVAIGVSQTLPAFLANAWLALLQHPDVMTRLCSEPTLLPGAIEELLRYAGLVHTLVRHAATDVTIGGAEIKAGQRLILKVADANRDSEQFHQPDCLIVDRRIRYPETGQLALGAGPHSCVGAHFVRLAAMEATRAFLERMPSCRLAGTVEWSHGPVLSFPRTLPAILA
ncbi:MAG TPA: cytochrome P450 [Bryobacteraceae bacterium]|nr:cytochrome P450 [Bryobacteraceae bacterium]